jgi:Domain of unknown function (DUF5063)
MSSVPLITSAFEEFSKVAVEFCAVIDTASSVDREEFLSQIYGILPRLIQKAIALPSLSYADDDDATTHGKQMKNVEWKRLYETLKKEVGEWNLYWQVFDPTKDSEAIRGSLADDLADIYRDLSDGLGTDKSDVALQRNAIFSWRSRYYSHWGQHAINALYAIHFFLNDRLS